VQPLAARDANANQKAPDPKTTARVEAIKADVQPGAPGALTAKTTDLLQTPSDGAPQGGPGDDAAFGPALEAKTDDAKTTQTQTQPDANAAAVATPANLIQTAAAAVHGAPQTVANLAAQIVKKLDGRSSQFDVQLDPAGLGKVDVRISIGADGRMTAAMSFDTPQAAAELRGRANELQQAMEKAGFDLSGGMSFDVAADSGQGGQAQTQQQDTGAAFRGRAFQAALDTTVDAMPAPQLLLRPSALAGVDIRI
jgi:flagellar hook-length control protein FliK